MRNRQSALRNEVQELTIPLFGVAEYDEVYEVVLQGFESAYRHAGERGFATPVLLSHTLRGEGYTLAMSPPVPH
jgi:hypothetical protein